MPRDIPLGNGQMLVAFDQHYQVRDLYYPYVGQENHVAETPCRFGAWGPSQEEADHAPRLYWSDDGWSIDLDYQHRALVSEVTLKHEALGVAIHCTDAVDFHRPLLVRRMDVTNLREKPGPLHLFHHHPFNMFGTRVGNTAYFDPRLRAMVHYRNKRYLMATWYADGELRIDQYATGTAGFKGAEGTWRDAENGALEGNAIAQGAVDSTMMLALNLDAGATQTCYLILGAGESLEAMQTLHRFLHRESPQRVIDRTTAYWRAWIEAVRTHSPSEPEGGLSERVSKLARRSMLILRTQIDNHGAIIAANDSDYLQYSRDTYSYLWPRDGALVAAAVDDAGFPDVARSFYRFCAELLTEEGFFLHKYNPDGSPASSWHPWVHEGKPRLPIQEDETALVLWALWRHFDRYRDIEFVRPLYGRLITRAADFLVRFRDPQSGLPLPSYDLWEERWGVHAFTVASVYGGLEAAAAFADAFGDPHRAETYRQAADRMKHAFAEKFWSPEHGRYCRRLVPTSADRVARYTSEVLAGHQPRADENLLVRTILPAGASAGQMPPEEDLAEEAYEPDPTIDSSLFALFAMGMFGASDDRVVATMNAIQEALTVRTEVGGIARYENDPYHAVVEQAGVPGNPWFICTLWLAQWEIARAEDLPSLRRAIPALEWAADHALPSGVLAEQVHPETGAPLSVSPLTWSHATVVATTTEYLRKLEEMTACPTCGLPQQCLLP